MTVKRTEISVRLSRVKIVAHTILRARISSTPMRLITRSRMSSGSDVKPVPGRHDMIEVAMAFEMGPPAVAGFRMPSGRPK
jgi:hypothetical protein